ncbi:MAG: 5'-3' exonuclease H3TH domain-containing protein, partial [Pseudomonadota bacterium]
MENAFGKGHHLHLIDGSAFIFRAFHALPPLTRKSDGAPVGAVSGFCNMLFKMVEDNTGPDAPTHVAVIFDKGSHTFRNDLYDQYKANRDAMPEDLRPQIPLTRDATRAFNIACIEKEGFEADDIIATYACEAREAGARVTIISSDKDLMQLVGGGVEMFDAMKNTRIGVEEVEAKFGVGPDRVIDIQALAGDSVDNIPGAPGIGIKTAALLINEFGDLDSLLERAGEIKQPKRRQTLIDHADQIRLSRDLVTLDQNTPDLEPISEMDLRAPVAEDLLAFLNLMEFRTLTKRVAEKYGAEVPETPEVPVQPSGAASPVPKGVLETPFEPTAYTCVRDAESLQSWIDQVYASGYVAVDTETTALDEMRADMVGISLCVTAGQACYIPLNHVNGAGDLLGGAERTEGQMDPAEALGLL